ncbi:MAG: hypothetical protein IPL32_14580 [Chloracidobacterium sp.]|nr:hypothetical protein [Chloracidobacterium sp.]
MRYISCKVVVLSLIVGTAATSLMAQNGRSKARPLATPPVVTGAEIISQSGDYVEPTTLPKTSAKPAATNAERIRDLNERLKKLESGKKNDYDDNQKRVLMNLDILTRAEQRADSLRKQLFEMIEKENTLRARLDQIEYDIRPEIIERALQVGGSMKPEEIRENRRKSLTAERANIQSLLAQVQTTRTNLEGSLLRAEQMVEKLRAKAEKDIDDSLQQDSDAEKSEERPEN